MSISSALLLAAALLQPESAPEPKPATVDAAALDGPGVTLSTLEGETFEGTLQGIGDGTVQLFTEDGALSVQMEQVLSIAFPPTTKSLSESQTVEVRMTDGSLVLASTVSSEKDQVLVKRDESTTTSVPVKGIRSIRLADPTGDTNGRWLELLERDFTTDALVVLRKGGVLDFIANGTIGTITEENVEFLLNGNPLKVKREKLFGLIYSRPESNSVPLCTVKVIGDQVINADDVTWKQNTMIATTAAGAKFDIPADQITSLDFSESKIQFLSAMEPKQVEPRFAFDEPHLRSLFEYKRDKAAFNQPLAIGRRTFRRGLWIHSENTLTYRLNGDYRQFKAIAGIANNLDGDVLLKITADGETLFEKRVTRTDEQIPLEFDVEGKRDLVIHVGFGVPFHDRCDHLVLGDARVIK